VVRHDGFEVDGEIYIELEGSTPATMAKSVGFGVVEFASEFHRLKPDIVLIIGDRYEALAAALAAAYMNITIVHLQGGEVSGSIDESARHAITKLAHFHYPATERARQYLLRMGEHPETILGVGCPSSDLARDIDGTLDSSILNNRGAGTVIDAANPFMLVVFHPTTTEYGGERSQMDSLLMALEDFKVPTVLLWPNIDAGSDHISKAIRDFRNLQDASWLRTLTNLTPENYLKVLAAAACAVGNSSSFVRDASFFGTPVVLVGDRQRFRETDVHVTHAPPIRERISEAIRKQLKHGRYAPSTLYGNGTVGERCALEIERLTPYLQKHLAYAQLGETG
jgi:UDP-hydrolysing UDP-N-acetyl-D-glucosamine 2-epimerase